MKIRILLLIISIVQLYGSVQSIYFLKDDKIFTNVVAHSKNLRELNENIYKFYYLHSLIRSSSKLDCTINRQTAKMIISGYLDKRFAHFDTELFNVGIELLSADIFGLENNDLSSEERDKSLYYCLKFIKAIIIEAQKKRHTMLVKLIGILNIDNVALSLYRDDLSDIDYNMSSCFRDNEINSRPDLYNFLINIGVSPDLNYIYQIKKCLKDDKLIKIELFKDLLSSVDLKNKFGERVLDIISQIKEIDLNTVEKQKVFFSIVSLVIDSGVNLNFKDIDGSTPVIKAIKSKSSCSLRFANMLIINGADILVENNYEESALSLLLNMDSHLYYKWIQSSKIDLVNLLRENISDLIINHKNINKYINYIEKIPELKSKIIKFLSAVTIRWDNIYLCAEYVKYYPSLKTRIIDYLRKSILNWNYIHLYIKFISDESSLKDMIISFLSEENLNGDKDFLHDQLYESSYSGNKDLVSLLIQAGVNVNRSTSIGNTPLIAACLKKHTEIVKILLISGADINFQNKKGETALMQAASAGCNDIVELLLSYGADKNIVDNKQLRAYSYVNREKKPSLYKILL